MSVLLAWRNRYRAYTQPYSVTASTRVTPWVTGTWQTGSAGLAQVETSQVCVKYGDGVVRLYGRYGRNKRVSYLTWRNTCVYRCRRAGTVPVRQRTHPPAHAGFLWLAWSLYGRATGFCLHGACKALTSTSLAPMNCTGTSGTPAGRRCCLASSRKVAVWVPRLWMPLRGRRGRGGEASRQRLRCRIAPAIRIQLHVPVGAVGGAMYDLR